MPRASGWTTTVRSPPVADMCPIVSAFSGRATTTNRVAPASRRIARWRSRRVEAPKRTRGLSVRGQTRLEAPPARTTTVVMGKAQLSGQTRIAGVTRISDRVNKHLIDRTLAPAYSHAITEYIFPSPICERRRDFCSQDIDDNDQGANRGGQ